MSYARAVQPAIPAIDLSPALAALRLALQMAAFAACIWLLLAAPALLLP